MKYRFESNEIKGCKSCFAYRLGMFSDRCLINDWILNVTTTDFKPNWCPLVEVQDE